MVARGKTEMLREVLEGFNEHDPDAIMSHFAEDCMFETPRGSERWGRRFVGKDEVRRGLAARFEGIRDVRYGDDDHFACGNRRVSEWTISGTTTDGVRVDVRGCDIWTFGDNGKIVRKDSFWKILKREGAVNPLAHCSAPCADVSSGDPTKGRAHLRMPRPAGAPFAPRKEISKSPEGSEHAPPIHRYGFPRFRHAGWSGAALTAARAPERRTGFGARGH